MTTGLKFMNSKKPKPKKNLKSQKEHQKNKVVLPEKGLDTLQDEDLRKFLGCGG